MARHMAWGLPVGFLVWDTYDTERVIAEVQCPVVVLAGGQDEVVPVEQSRRVAAAAPRLQAYEEDPGVGHNDEQWFDGEFAARVAAVVENL